MSSAPTRGCRAVAVVFACCSMLAAPALADTAPKPRAKPPQQTAHTGAAPKRAELQILTRAAWQAKPPLFRMNGHVPLAIVVHHTAGPVNGKRDIAYKMRSLQAYSQKPAQLGNGRSRKAWADVPYHFYISAEGAVAEGRSVKFSGDTNTNYDTTGYIQIVLEGNFERTRPTPEQLTALETLLVQVAKAWKISGSEIQPHRSLAATLCPGKHLIDALPTLQNRVVERLN